MTYTPPKTTRQRLIEFLARNPWAINGQNVAGAGSMPSHPLALNAAQLGRSGGGVRAPNHGFYQTNSIGNINQTNLATNAGDEPNRGARPGVRASISELKYRAVAALDRLAGYEFAARNLKHFLDGSGSDLVINSNWLRSQSGVQEAYERNDESFQRRIRIEGDRLKTDSSKSLKNDFHVRVTPRRGSDLFYGSGDSTLSSYGEFRLTKNKNGRVTVTGKVLHIWHDRYDWHDGLSVTIGLLKFDDKEANELVKNGQAAEFDMESRWYEEY